MSIKTPTECVYYQVSTNEPDQLIYWIPFDKLKDFVNKNKADNKILIDYPDGVDIVVSDDDFTEFKELYNLEFDLDPKSIKLVFEYLQKEKLKKRAGYVRSEVIETMAKRISEKDMEIIQKSKKFDPRQILRKKKNLTIMFKNELAEKAKKVKSFSTRSVFKSSEDDVLYDVKMSKGKEPIEGLYKLQRQYKGRK